MPIKHRSSRGSTVVTSLATEKQIVVGGQILSVAELAALDGVTAGTVTASKAVIVSADKDIGDFRNLDVTNLDAGSSGTAGSVDIFPSGTTKGKLAITCANQTGNTTVTLNANEMGQATTVNIPDPGAAAGYVALSTAALSLAEVDVLQDVTAGTVAGSKAVVVSADKDAGDFRNLDAVNIDAGSSGVAGTVDIFPSTSSRGKLIISATDTSSGDYSVTLTNAANNTSNKTVTIPALTGYVGLSTAALSLAEMDVLDAVTAGTAAASKAAVLGSDKNLDTLVIADGGLYLGSGAGTAVTSTAAELNLLDTATVGTIVASKAVISGANGQLDWSGITPLYAASTGRDNSWIKMGTWATPIEITQTSDHWGPIQVNIKKSGDIAFDTFAARLRVDTGAAQSTSAIGCLQLRQNISHAVASSAILNASVTIGDAVVVGSGSVLGGYFSIEGSGAITKAGANDCTVLTAVYNGTGGGVDNVLIAMQNGTGTTVTEILKVISVHGNATYGIHVYPTVTDSAIGTGIMVSGGGQAMCGISVGAFASSYATGSALLFSAANTAIARFYGESTSDLTNAYNCRTVVGRHLVVTASATVNHETYGMIGQVCVKNTTLGHLHAGVMGTFEVSTAATVPAGDALGAAGLMARIGGATITVGSTGVLAGVLATQNATTVSVTSGGVFAAFACRKVGSGITWNEALHIEDALVAFRFKAADNGYAHGIKAVAAEPAGNTSHAIAVMIGTTPGYIPVYAAETF